MMEIYCMNSVRTTTMTTNDINPITGRNPVIKSQHASHIRLIITKDVSIIHYTLRIKDFLTHCR
jgi:hypothetical protein